MNTEDDTGASGEPSPREPIEGRRSYRSNWHGSKRSGSRGLRRYLAPTIGLLALACAVFGYFLVAQPDRRPLDPTLQPAASDTRDSSRGQATQAAPAAERTAALPPLKLPADDAPHGSGMEWWYYNGILSAQGGQRYAFHVAVFVANGLIKHTVMHMALTDLQTGRRYSSQSRTGGVPALNVANGFDFRQDGWQVSAVDASHVLKAAFDGASFSMDLKDARTPVAHRAHGSQTPGLLDFGTSGISYYYSRPRMSATGQVAIAGRTQQVSGEVWFDHQWGDFDVLSLGWNWFALHLDDGSDLMLYQLFDMQGRSVLTAGTRSDPSGSTPLKPEDIVFTPVKRWASPATQVSYIVEWDIRLPSGELRVKPWIANGEFNAATTTANIYWEGPVKVSGSATGEGFMELSGYERLKALPPEPARAR
ncbi:Predicted secreted hydrolase [Burkholderiales bacterium 8X]|nr:Predicted secreted hydrolase [Burkholderiales bacterium 8X]